MSTKKNATVEKPRNIIATRMRRARRRAQPRVTQADLSARVAAYGVDLDQASISRIEAGKRLVADYELKAIASALAVSIAWLVKEDETFRDTPRR